MLRVICLLISLTISRALFSQVIISGKIISNNYEPILLATISIQGQDGIFQTTQTRAEGSFALTLLVDTSFVVQVSAIGYETISKTFYQDKKGSNMELPPIVLMQHVKPLENVQVVGRRRSLEMINDRMVINLQNSPTAVSGSALEVIGRAPNIVIDRLSQEILINGKGSMVTINGKPIRMDGAALLDYLQSLPASALQKIEFIHSPPADFDAGGGGVINLVLQESDKNGMIGTWSLGAGYGQNSKLNQAVQFQVRQKRLHLNVTMTGSQNQSRSDVTNNFYTVDTTGQHGNLLFSKRPSYMGLSNGLLSLDYQVDSKTSIGFQVSGYASRWKLRAISISEIDQNSQRTLTSILYSNERNNWNHLMANINGQHQWASGAKLHVDLDNLYYLDKNPTNYKEDKTGMPASVLFRSRKETPINFKVGKLDYIWPKKGRMALQAGVKSTITSLQNIQLLERWQIDRWKTDNNFSSDLSFKENIMAIYVTGDLQKTPKTVWKGGLRYEWTYTSLSEKSAGRLLQKQKGRLFPTLSYQRQWKSLHQFTMAYVQRINRPSFNALAPAFFFFGPQTILTGNPAVQAMLSRQLTTTYQLNRFTLTLQLSADRNPFLTQPRILDSFVVIQTQNMKSQRQAVLSVHYQQRGKVWASQYTLSLFGQTFQPVFNDKVYRTRSIYGQFQTNQSFHVRKDLQIEIINQTRLPRNVGLGRQPFTTSFTLGWQKAIGKRSRFSFNWVDAFNLGSFYQMDYQHPSLGLVNHYRYELEGSIFQIQFQFRFGGVSPKKAVTRVTASEEESRRVQ